MFKTRQQYQGDNKHVQNSLLIQRTAVILKVADITASSAGLNPLGGP